MKALRKLYNPSLFQGDLFRTGYFEGWYFKQVSADLQHVYAFIPGIALGEAESERYAFIQVIDGISGRTHFVRYPLEKFDAAEKSLEVRVGGSTFTDSYIALNIDTEALRVQGRVDFAHLSPYPKRLLSPGIMGWYSFVPRMECKHGLVSMTHRLEGRLQIDGTPVDFTGGKGYIEKDWGSSFPESWIWMQSNHFSDPNTSFMLSVAKIPWMGGYFMGFLSFLKIGAATRFFATYNGSKIVKITNLSRRDSAGKTELEGVELRIDRESPSGREELRIRAESTQGGALKSPVRGRMDSFIKESVDAELRLDYRSSDGRTYRDTGRRGGLEIVEQIFSYFSA
ncbi:MAG: tocopherol cyclase family protein [Spirochaetia bacterium]